MKRIPVFTAVLLLLVLLSSSIQRDDDFIPLFNNINLDGWVNVNCAPETWTVKDEMIICSGIPNGILRTAVQYENFILELEWKHLFEGGNAGLFIHSDAITALGKPFSRSIECQIMDGNHGDMFAIQGAALAPDNEDPLRTPGWMRSYPTEERVNPAGEWNHYRIISRDGIVSLEINGKMVTRGFYPQPRKGYICLESEGSEVHFRNIRIKTLPGSNPPDIQIATPEEGYKALYNGADLRGWKSENMDQAGWLADNWILKHEKTDISNEVLWSENEFENFRLIVDWRLSSVPVIKKVPVVSPDGTQATDENGALLTVQILDAGEGRIYLRGSEENAVDITCWPIGSGSIVNNAAGYAINSKMHHSILPLIRADQAQGQWNRFEITLDGNHVTIILNGTTVIENVQLSDIPARGPLALVSKGSTIEFTNIYIKNL